MAGKLELLLWWIIWQCWLLRISAPNTLFTSFAAFLPKSLPKIASARVPFKNMWTNVDLRDICTVIIASCMKIESISENLIKSTVFVDILRRTSVLPSSYFLILVQCTTNSSIYICQLIIMILRLDWCKSLHIKRRVDKATRWINCTLAQPTTSVRMMNSQVNLGIYANSSMSWSWTFSWL